MIFREEVRMAYKIRDEFRRPAPLALAAVAIVGWLLVAYFSSRVSAVQSEMNEEVNRAEHAREGMAADLQDLQKASGSLAEVQKQAEEAKIALSKATAARAASQNELADLNKQITDARLTVSGTQEQASARARDFQAIDAQAKEAADQLAVLQPQVSDAQNQLDAATSERDKTLAAVANTRNQLSGLQQQADADAKSLASLQEQSDAAAKNLVTLQQQAAEASTTLAGLQAKIKAAQTQAAEGDLSQRSLLGMDNQGQQASKIRIRARLSRRHRERDHCRCRDQAERHLRAACTMPPRRTVKHRWAKPTLWKQGAFRCSRSCPASDHLWIRWRREGRFAVGRHEELIPMGCWFRQSPVETAAYSHLPTR
jgi:chromosome segregation ATPase